MEKQVKVFFKNLSDTDLFLFKKLYVDPESILGSKQDMYDAEEEYNNLFYYCDLMMNNNLSDFIIAIYYDDEFRKRVADNEQIWRKLNFFLYDSLEFKKYYYIKDDKYLMDLLEDKISIKDYLSKHKPPYPLLSIFEIYKKYQRLYNHNFDVAQIEEYDEKKNNDAEMYINIIFIELKRKMDKKKNKEIALKWVKNDDYSENADPDNAYLCRYSVSYSGLDNHALDELVCENKFLEIIEEKLNNNQITGFALENAIDIIQLGISIKKHQQINMNFYRDRVGEEQIQGFNLEFAEELVSKLIIHKKRNRNKIIQYTNFKKIN